MKIVIDFETYSEVDITKQGAYIYADHSSTKILCMSYKISNAPTQIWLPDNDSFPKELINLKSTDKIYAFNATFEILIWHKVGLKDFPQFFKPVLYKQWIDVQALSARYGFPLSLDKAAKAIGCDHTKLAIGKRLIRVCCTPGYRPTEQDYQDLYKYCKVDTDTTHEILQKLPANYLTLEEQDVWIMTLEMNIKGVPIDIKEVKAIINYLASYMQAMTEVLPDITNGEINTAGQVQKIKDFCCSHGVMIENLQAETVKNILENDDSLPDVVRTVLEIRQLIGLTSVKKFITLSNLYNRGFVQGNLIYYGASNTGRFAGRGFQYQNLPRTKVDNPEEYIKKFIYKDEIDRPVDIAKALIRPMIKAPAGYQLIVSDYSAIENRVLAWLSNDNYALDLFIKGKDQYKDMASYLYHKPVKEIQKHERQLGKAVILGCLAQGTKVLTDKGVKNIEDVQLMDKVFDGDNFVAHEGVIYKGLKPCISINHLNLTKDHKILVQKQNWREAWHLKESIQLENQAINLATSKLLNQLEFMGMDYTTLQNVSNAEMCNKDGRVTLKGDLLNNVALALEKQKIKISLLIQKYWEYHKNTSTDYVTEYMQYTQDAINPIIDAMLIMVQEVLNVIGEKTLYLCLNTLSLYLDGVTQHLKLIESITMMIIDQGTLDSWIDQLNAVTHDEVQKLSTKAESTQERNSLNNLRQSIEDLIQFLEKLGKVKQQNKFLKTKNTAKERTTYDLLNVGTTNRFMVFTSKGPLIVHNCGYQMGAKRFREVAKSWSIILNDIESQSIIKAYRAKYNKVVKTWYAFSDFSKYAVQYAGKKYETRKCSFRVVKDKMKRTWLRVTLPSGRALMYQNPRLEDDKYGAVVKYTGMDSTTHQIKSTALSPGLITENIVQATARDILIRGMLNLKNKMPEVELILSVHDECGGLIKEEDINDNTMKKFNSLLCQVDWAVGLPLAAEGYIAKRYRKE